MIAIFSAPSRAGGHMKGMTTDLVDLMHCARKASVAARTATGNARAVVAQIDGDVIHLQRCAKVFIALGMGNEYAVVEVARTGGELHRKSPTVQAEGATMTTALRRRPNSEFRSREHLIETEVEKLIEAAKDNRYGHRDATMILAAYRHGLRASEICSLRWEQVDFNSATLHVRRVKNGKPSTHPVRDDQLRALHRLQREAPKSPFLFVSERGGPFTTDSFNWMVKRAGHRAGLPFQAHAHMLRHAAGYKLASDGHDTRSIQGYLGHQNIQHIVRYTELSPTRFKDFWRD